MNGPAGAVLIDLLEAVVCEPPQQFRFGRAVTKASAE